jgi:hypothetical protein
MEGEEGARLARARLAVGAISSCARPCLFCFPGAGPRSVGCSAGWLTMKTEQTDGNTCLTLHYPHFIIKNRIKFGIVGNRNRSEIKEIKKRTEM